MAFSQSSLELRSNTDGNFRLWANFISAGMLAGGWTLVYSAFASGSSWANVTTPAQNAYAVTEIWQSPAESGLTPFYVKLRYGSQNNATLGPAIEYQVGWVWTSGANLGGTPTPAITSQVNTAAAEATARLCTIAAGAGYAGINLGSSQGSSCNHWIGIERTRGSDVEKQDDILLFGRYYPGSGATSNLTRYSSDSFSFTSTTQADQYVLPPSTVALGAVVRGAVTIGYISGFGKGRTSPSELFLGVITNSLGAAGQLVPITAYGVTRNYLIGTAGSSQTPGSFGVSGTYQTLYLCD